MNVNLKIAWVGSFIREENNKAYYNCVKITDTSKSKSSKYSVGDIVYFESGRSLPFIAEINSLYECKTSGEKKVIAKWYYRAKDVKELAWNALDDLKPKRYTELYYSEMKDENDVWSILKHISVLFFNAGDVEDEKLIESIFSSSNKLETKDTFFCRYLFDTTNRRVEKVKGSKILSLRDQHKQNKNPFILGISLLKHYSLTTIRSIRSFV